MSTDDASLIKPMLVDGISESNLLPTCKQSGGFNSMIAKFIGFVAPQSTAGMRYTPPITVAASSSGMQDVQSTGTVPNSNTPPKPSQPMNRLAGSGSHHKIGQQANQSDPRILFGVRGPYPALKLEQISIKNMTKDSDFYEELKRYYRLNRGRLRYWFSFWRLGYCEVVKASHEPRYKQARTDIVHLVSSLQAKLRVQGTQRTTHG
jgi:hypothetical protein